MSEPAIPAQKAQTNGHGNRTGPTGPARRRARHASAGSPHAPAAAARRLGGEAFGVGTALAGGVLGRVVKRAQRAVSADLDDRDPDYIRENLSLSWLISTL